MCAFLKACHLIEIYTVSLFSYDRGSHRAKITVQDIIMLTRLTSKKPCVKEEYLGSRE